MANEFFTLTSLGTLAGATGATVAVTNGLRTALNINPRWLGLLISEIVCVGVLLASGPSHASDWFICVLNGFLVFATSAGATAVGAAAAGNAPAKQGAAARSGNVAVENVRRRGGGGAAGDPAARSGNVAVENVPAVPTKPPFWSPWF